jgi:vesicle-associated membrane protein 7
MSLIHAVISRGPIILAESSTDAGSYSSAIETILQRIPSGASKLTYSADEHLFHYVRTSDSFTVLVMADDSLGRCRRPPIGCMQD